MRKMITVKQFAQLILLLLFFATGFPLIAQHNNTRFEHISWEEGLSQVTVKSIIQDGRGFMWFATDDGLNKYNGYNFEVYRHEFDDSLSLSSNQVTFLFEDSRNTLWIGTKKGLNRFDKNQETFTSYYHKANDKMSLSNDFINGICEDINGTIWVATNYGLNKLDRISGEFTRFLYESDSSSSGLSSNLVKAIVADKLGNVWIGTERGLDKLDVSKEEITRYTDKANFIRDYVTSLFIDNKGNLWIGTPEEVSHYELDEEVFNTYRYKTESQNNFANYIFSISQDKSGRMWLGTNGGGLLIFDQKLNKFTNHAQDDNNLHSISHNTVISIYRDRSGTMWVGTQAGGINKINSTDSKFRIYQQIPNSNSLSGNNIWGILEDSDGILWVAADQALNSYSKNTGIWTQYTYSEGDPHGLSSKGVWSVFEDKDGFLWIGGGGGLNRFNKTTERFIHYKNNPGDPNSLSSNSVWQVTEDKEGLLWITTLGGGLNSFDKNKGTFFRYQNDPQDSSSLSNNVVWNIHIDDAGVKWIATNEGLNRLDKSGRFTHYVNKPGDKNSLSNNFIYDLYEDDKGILWIGTNGGGLNKFDKASGMFKSYQEKDGLINNVIYAVEEDNNGYLWLSTNKGLSRFNPATEVFQSYDARDGLQSNEFNAGASFKSSTGELYFGGINGMNAFHPDSIKGNSVVPPVVISDFQIFNESVKTGENSPLQKQISETRHVTLSYKESVITFEFVALNYVNTEKNQYAYMLEGFDKDWYYVGNRRFATYTNIPPGTYTFRVKGSNNDEVWNEEGASVELTIVPPFWQTTWFYALLFIFLVLLVLIIFRLRLRNLQKARKLLEKQVDKQTRELSEEKERAVEQNVQLNNINEELKITLKDLQSTQMQLVQSEKMASLGQLTAGVAHEINNPVNFISAGIDSLRIDYEDILELLNRYRNLNEHCSEQQMVNEVLAFEKEIGLEELLAEIEQLFAGIKDGALRTKEIVKSLQSFSRLDEDHLKKANLNDGIEATLVILQSSINSKIQIKKDYANLPEIDCYPGQINQVFMNILSNAIQAIEGEGTIEIVTRTDDDHVIVKVRDSGKGIPPEIINKVFDPFFTTKEVGQGTGLGLSVSYGIVTKHHGELSVTSGEEEGTTFTITLPLNPTLAEKQAY